MYVLLDGERVSLRLYPIISSIGCHDPESDRLTRGKLTEFNTKKRGIGLIEEWVLLMTTLDRVCAILIHLIGHRFVPFKTVKHNIAKGKRAGRCYVCIDNHIAGVREIRRTIEYGVDLRAPAMTTFIENYQMCMS